MASPSPSKKRGVPIELEPLADLDRGDMSDEVWRELNGLIQYEAASVQATGVIIPSPARNRNKGGSQGRDRSLEAVTNNNGNNGGDEHSSSSAVNTSKFPRRFPAMESFFQALSTLGVTKQNYRGLAMLHNSAQLTVWQTTQGGPTAQMRAQLQEKVKAQSEAIDESLRSASERARVLREEQAKELAAQQPKKPGGDDQYLKDLQNSRIDAEFERMRDQLRAEDAARRAQLEYAREEKQKESKERELAERKARLQAEREQRHREREERLRELQQQEVRALDHFESALREHSKAKTTATSSSSPGGAPAAVAAARN